MRKEILDRLSRIEPVTHKPIVIYRYLVPSEENYSYYQATICELYDEFSNRLDSITLHRMESETDSEFVNRVEAIENEYKTNQAY